MTPTERLVRDYLGELRSAGRELPRARRAELLAEIEAHIAEALPAGAAEVDVRELLDRLGEPEEIVAAERERLGLVRVRGGAREGLALVFLVSAASCSRLSGGSSGSSCSGSLGCGRRARK